jgi:hypothetical protein
MMTKRTPKPNKAQVDANGTPLPAGMYFRSGRYYLVKRNPFTKKVVWTSLSKNLGEALAQHRLLAEGKPEEAFDRYGAPAHWLSDVFKILHAQTKKRAQEADILFSITLADVVNMGMSTNWRCAVTGTRLRKDEIPGSSMRPFMPSIDRINPARGYTAANCRVVCVAANFAMNDWGEGVLRELALNYVEHHGIAARLEASNGIKKPSNIQSL